MSIANNFDRVRARVKYELGSAICQQFPNTIGKLAVGEDPVRWYLARTRASQIKNWQHDPGFAGSGQAPAGYRAFMVVHTNGPLLDKWAHRINAQPAAAFRAFPGKEPVVVTTLPFGEWPERPDPVEHLEETGETLGELQRQVMFGLGPTALDATVGLYLPQERAFMPDLNAEHIIETDITREAMQARFPQAIHV